MTLSRVGFKAHCKMNENRELKKISLSRDIYTIRIVQKYDRCSRGQSAKCQRTSPVIMYVIYVIYVVIYIIYVIIYVI